MLRIRKQGETKSGHETASGWAGARTLSTGAIVFALDGALDHSQPAQEAAKALPESQTLI